jgi:hypothetical protein
LKNKKRAVLTLSAIRRCPMRKQFSKIICLVVMCCTLVFLFSCGVFIKETISYEVDGTGIANISYTSKYGSTLLATDQTLPWYKSIYYLFDEETELETVILEVSSADSVTTKIMWHR